MTKISLYPTISSPEGDDILIGTDVNNSDITKNFKIQDMFAIGLETSTSKLKLYDTTLMGYGEVSLDNNTFLVRGAGLSPKNLLISSAEGYISFKKDTYTAEINASSITEARTWSMPDEDGTVALISDIPSGSSVTKVLKTTITSAEVLQLFTTPITVLDSSEAGKVKLPLNVWVQRNPGDAYSLSTASFQLINDSGLAISGNLNPNPLVGTSIGFFTSAFNIIQNSSGSDKNYLYKLKAASGNPTGGTGDLDVYVTYIEITL